MRAGPVWPRNSWPGRIISPATGTRSFWRRDVCGVLSGQMGEQGAAAELEGAGFRGEEALTTARKYALRPGYQVCYTVGLYRFLALLDGYGAGDLGSFVGAVMSGGEVGFEDLERSLRRRRKK